RASADAEARREHGVRRVTAARAATAVLAVGGAARQRAVGGEGVHLVQAQRHRIGQLLRGPVQAGGNAGEVVHVYCPEMRTRSALANWSVPETTMRSPSSSPDTISTALRLLAPAWIGRRTALEPSTTQAK